MESTIHRPWGGSHDSDLSQSVYYFALIGSVQALWVGAYVVP
jgi:hypothetical protein